MLSLVVQMYAGNDFPRSRETECYLIVITSMFLKRIMQEIAFRYAVQGFWYEEGIRSPGRKVNSQ